MQKYKAKGEPLPQELQESIDKTRGDYERWLDAKHAAARGYVDAIIDPKDSREVLSMALELCMQRPRAEALVLETL